MNIQAISEFMDLVKNPEKYAKYLAELKDAKDQLNAAAELVGKASDIEKLQKQAIKRVETAEAKATAIEQEANAAAIKRQEVYDNLFKDLAIKTDAVTAVKQSADAKLAHATQVEKDVSERERQLRADQKAYNDAAADLAKKTAEVDEKLSKLRALMGE